MYSSIPSDTAFATAFVGLRPMFLAPDLDVVARRPDGVVELRFNGRDGSYLETSILVPSCLAAAPRLRILDIHAWYAPMHMLLRPFGLDELRRLFLLLLFVDFCRDAVMEALGPGARHAAWWTDTPPIDRSCSR